MAEEKITEEKKVIKAQKNVNIDNFIARKLRAVNNISNEAKKQSAIARLMENR